MGLRLNLMGVPSVELDGTPLTPRGRKTWALLALLLLTDTPLSRRRLATLLFDEADDPLGALRWSLADARRCLGSTAQVGGDPVTIELGADASVDVIDVTHGRLPASSGVAELLEGLTFDHCAGFETWLTAERRRLAALTEALLHETALTRLTAGKTSEAIALANQLVQANPLDENNHAFLVRCLATSGDRAGALDQVQRCIALFEKELGVLPSPAVRSAADAQAGSARRAPSIGRAAARAQLEAGQAAITAGAVDAGLDCLRRAIAEAESCGDDTLRAQSMLALGGALVHAVRGRDEEGASVLHQAIALADECGEPSVAGVACRELGFVDVQAGRNERAKVWLERAYDLAADDGERAAVLGVRGMNLSDHAHYGRALEILGESVDLARSAGARRQEAWTLGNVARVRMLRGDLDEARLAAAESFRIGESERWTAYLSWPGAMRGDVELASGDAAAAHEHYAHAYALAQQVGDPCWEGVAGRGMGLVEANAGDIDGAFGWLDEARTRCSRFPDHYLWVRARVLDSICDLAITANRPDAAARVDEFADISARAGLRDMIARSHVHRARLGQPGAREAAVLAAADIDSPALAELVASLD